VGPGNIQIFQERRDQAGSHDLATVGVQQQLTGRDTVFQDRLLNEVLCDRLTFALLDGPADHIPAVDVQDDVQVEVRMFDRASCRDACHAFAPFLQGAKY
jgi:hypothetical protein